MATAMTRSFSTETTPREHRKWTVMVYMAAGNDSRLDAVAVQDLREMERGANSNVHIAVQINRAWPDTPQRYEVRKSEDDPKRGESALVDLDEAGADMGEGATLSRFVKWAAKIFPAEHYFLILWGHAYGLGFGRDHNDGLRLKELKGALEDFRQERLKLAKSDAEAPKGRLELLGANSCAMSYVEAAYELRKAAHYMVASQISVPFAGWPYESILRRIADTTEPEDLGRLVADTYVGHFNALARGERVTMSLLNLEGLDGWKSLIQQLAEAIEKETLSGTGNLDSARLAYVRDTFVGAAAGDVRPLIDLYDLCDDFCDADSVELRTVADDIKERHKSLVIHHQRHPDLDDLNGIGIFAPFVTDDNDLKRLELEDPARETGGKGEVPKRKAGREEYKALDLFNPAAQRVTWPSLVYDELRQEISPEIIMSMAEIGATKRADRADLTQIMLGIHSAFNKLDRVLAEAKTRVADKLRAAASNKELPPDPGENGATRSFGPPCLRLIQPFDLRTKVAILEQLKAFKELASAMATSAGVTDLAGAGVAGPPAGWNPTPGSSPAIGTPHPRGPFGGQNVKHVNTVVDFFAKVERAVAEVERATKRGLTHAKFGLGPLNPNQFNIEDPKSGYGIEDPKSGYGIEDPKSGYGIEDPKSGYGDPSNGNGLFSSAAGGDLRVDVAFIRVTELFRQVGQSLQGLEAATLEVENAARATLVNAQTQDMSDSDLLLAAAEEIGRGFRVLEDASTNARRTVQRVLAHPVFGVGPGGGDIGLEERQALAAAGGLDRRNLRLL